MILEALPVVITAPGD